MQDISQKLTKPMSVKESAKEFLTLLEDKKYSYVEDLIETLIAQKDY